MNRPSRPWFIAAIFTTVVGLAPIVSVVVASAIADANGCRLDEGGIHPCVIAGHDFGGLLATMGVFGWLMLVSIWPLLLSPVLWVVAIAKRRRERASG